MCRYNCQALQSRPSTDEAEYTETMLQAYLSNVSVLEGGLLRPLVSTSYISLRQAENL